MQQMFTVPSSQPALAAIASSFAPGLLERHLAEMNPWINADPLLAQAPDLTCSLRHAPADIALQGLPSSGFASSALAQPTHTLSAPTRQLTIGPPSLHPGLPHVSVAAQTQPEVPAVPTSRLHHSACMALSSAHVARMAPPVANDETRRRSLLSRELRRLKEVRQLLGPDRQHDSSLANSVSTQLGPPSDTVEPAVAGAAGAAGAAPAAPAAPRPQPPPPPPPPLPPPPLPRHKAHELMSLLPQTRPLQTPASQPESMEPLLCPPFRPPPTQALHQSAQGPQQNQHQLPSEGPPQFLQYAQEAINAAQEVTRLTQELERTQQDLETARRSVATLATRFGGLVPHLAVGKASEGLSTSDSPVQHFVHHQESATPTTEATAACPSSSHTTSEQSSVQHTSDHALTAAQTQMQHIITANVGNDPTASVQARNFIEEHSNPASLATMMQHVKILLEYQQALAASSSAADVAVAEVPPQSHARAARSTAENLPDPACAEAAKHTEPAGEELSPGAVRTAKPPAMAPGAAASEPKAANRASSLSGHSLVPTFRRPLSLYPATDVTNDADTQKVALSNGSEEAVPANKDGDSMTVGAKQATSAPASRRGCWRRATAQSTASNRARKRRATEVIEPAEPAATEGLLSLSLRNG